MTAADFGAPLKHRYTRPQFLQLTTDDEIQVTADHSIRPIIVPRDITKIPWNSGYAECINAGKSIRNEDQAAIYRGVLRTVVTQDVIGSKVADMMPLVPSHPRQVPINGRNLTIAEAIRMPTEVPGSAQNGSIDSETVIPADTHSLALPTSVSLPDLNGKTSTPLTNGDSRDAEANDAETKALKTLDVSHLLSPSEPLPLNNIVSSPSIETITAALERTSIVSSTIRSSGLVEESLPWTYFAMFDGHAGPGVAVAASLTLHRIIQDKLQNISDLLIAFGLNKKKDVSQSNGDKSDDADNIKMEDLELVDGIDATILNRRKTTMNGSLIINHDQHLPSSNTVVLFRPPAEKIVTVDSLIIGALESAFWDMDNQIALDKRHFRMPGGCTALVSLFVLGKLYVANAGDSRCIMSRNRKVNPMSFDHTPETERQRVKYLVSSP